MIKVSVIIPVYNCEDYIENAVESVINQNLSGVEIVLINDGSKDNSLNICKELYNKYNNIKVLTQENLGPGHARNRGLEVACGEYATFLDGDDLLPDNIFKYVYSLVSQYNADIFIGNILCFNDVRTWHLPYMKDVFLPNKKIKIGKVSDMVEINGSTSVCNKWFKLNLIRENNIKFNEKIRVGEDLLFTQEAFLESNKIITKDIDIYKYRLINKESLIKNSNIEFFENLLDLQRQIVKLYIDRNISSKYILLRQLVFFVDSIFLKVRDIPEVLINQLIYLGIEIFKVSDEIKIEEKYFRSKERYLLALLLKEHDKENAFNLIDNYIIKDQKKLIIKEEDRYYSYLYKEFKKYKEVLVQEAIIESKVENAYIDEEDILTIRGYSFIRGIDFSNNSKIKRQLVLKGKNNLVTKDIKSDYRTDLTYLFKSDLVNYHWGGYEPIEIRLSELNDDEYEAYIKLIIDDNEFTIPFEFKLAEIKNKLKVRYLKNDNIKREVFCRFSQGKYLNIRIAKLSRKSYSKSKIRRVKRDLRYDFSLIKRKKYRSFLVLYLYKLFSWYFRRKNIWLMGERKDTAQDNTYHLFKYIKEEKKDVNVKYIITKDSKDLDNIIKYGDIVWFDSILHNLYLLTCKFTINSYAEKPNMYTNEYIDIIKYYPEFVKNKKVFLQHGVIGVSRVNHVLHKNRVNYDYFVVSSEYEKNHILQEFGYKDEEVIITGLPRWDNLNTNANKNKILLMPTWRAWIKSEGELFESKYFKTYLSLLNNGELHKFLLEKKYELTFYPHYQTQKLLSKIDNKFHPNIRIVKQGEKSVQSLINENYILITDYSTVAFDFAYCNKPVIFYQFDYDEFYSKHYNEGPIDHKKDLFGDRAITINQIINSIKEVEKIKMNKSFKYILKEKKHCENIYLILNKRR